MATDVDSTDVPGGHPASRGADYLLSGRTEQEEYDFIMGQIDALLGRLDVQMPVARARLDRVLEEIRSRAPR
jgi:hypothetical protein